MIELNHGHSETLSWLGSKTKCNYGDTCLPWIWNIKIKFRFIKDHFRLMCIFQSLCYVSELTRFNLIICSFLKKTWCSYWFGHRSGCAADSARSHAAKSHVSAERQLTISDSNILLHKSLYNLTLSIERRHWVPSLSDGCSAAGTRWSINIYETFGWKKIAVSLWMWFLRLAQKQFQIQGRHFSSIVCFRSPNYAQR